VEITGTLFSVTFARSYQKKNKMQSSKMGEIITFLALVVDVLLDFFIAGKQFFIPQHLIMWLRLLPISALESVFKSFIKNIGFYPYACF
jgi:Na+/pantothenate symporter